jgi:hypothetical protein
VTFLKVSAQVIPLPRVFLIKPSAISKKRSLIEALTA